MDRILFIGITFALLFAVPAMGQETTTYHLSLCSEVLLHSISSSPIHSVTEYRVPDSLSFQIFFADEIRELDSSGLAMRPVALPDLGMTMLRIILRQQMEPRYARVGRPLKSALFEIYRPFFENAGYRSPDGNELDDLFYDFSYDPFLAMHRNYVSDLALYRVRWEEGMELLFWGNQITKQMELQSPEGKEPSAEVLLQDRNNIILQRPVAFRSTLQNDLDSLSIVERKFITEHLRRSGLRDVHVYQIPLPFLFFTAGNEWERMLWRIAFMLFSDPETIKDLLYIHEKLYPDTSFTVADFRARGLEYYKTVTEYISEYNFPALFSDEEAAPLADLMRAAIRFRRSVPRTGLLVYDRYRVHELILLPDVFDERFVHFYTPAQIDAIESFDGLALDSAQSRLPEYSTIEIESVRIVKRRSARCSGIN